MSLNSARQTEQMSASPVPLILWWTRITTTNNNNNNKNKFKKKSGYVRAGCPFPWWMYVPVRRVGAQLDAQAATQLCGDVMCWPGSGKVKEKKGSPHFGDHSLTLALVDDGCALSAFRASLMSSYCWTKVTRPVACIQNGEFSIWLLWRRRRRRKKITIGLLGALFTVASWYPQTSVRYPVSPSRLEICCATLPRTVSPP